MSHFTWNRWETVEDADVEAVENETARAIYELAAQVGRVAYQLCYLGNGNAATTMGAIEGLSVSLERGLSVVADSIERSKGS